MRVRAALLAAVWTAGPVLAEAPDTVLRPVARPVVETVAAAVLRPVARPPAEGDTQADLAIGPAAAVLAEVTEPPVPPEAGVIAAALPGVRPMARPEEDPPLRPVARPGAGTGTAAEEVLTASLAAPVLSERLSTTSPVVLAEPMPEGGAIPAAMARAEGGLLPPAVLLDRGAEVRPALRPAPGWVALPVPVGAAPGEDDHWTESAVAAAFRPPERPENLVVQAAARVTAAPQPGNGPPRGPAPATGGALCGSAEIRGEVLGSVPGPGSCGVEDAVRVTAVAGVRMSSPLTVDCRTAEALLRWTERTALPAVGDYGGGLASLQVMGTYSCRGRNGQPGARLSEHAFGRAIDIGGFGLRNGTSFTVLNGWNSGSYAQILRAMHRGACGLFGTVLGPEANAFHRDHFHFDTARHRSGSYCR